MLEDTEKALSKSGVTARQVQYDVIRVFAAFSIVVIHASAQYVHSTDVKTAYFSIAYVWDAVFRYGVPFFIMLTGALFLDENREFSVKKIWTRYILRLAIIYFVWAFIYASIDCVWSTGEFSILCLKNAIIEPKYHLWYIPMIIGLYTLIPVFKKIVGILTKDDFKYLFILFAVLCIGRTTIIALDISYSLNTLLNSFKFEVIYLYLGYFFLGYYISKYEIEKKKRTAIYLSGVCGIILNIIIGIHKSRLAGTFVDAVIDNNTLFSALWIIGLYVFLFYAFKNKGEETWGCKALRNLSLDSMGVYLIHLFFVERLVSYSWDYDILHGYFSIPVVVIISFTCAIIITAILRRIPLIGRYIC